MPKTQQGKRVVRYNKSNNENNNSPKIREEYMHWEKPVANQQEKKLVDLLLEVTLNDNEKLLPKSLHIFNQIGGPESLDGKKAVLARIRRISKSYKKDTYKILIHTGSGTNENGESIEDQLLKICPQYHKLKSILGDRNTDVANPGNPCGNTISLVAYTSPSAGPSSPSVITQRHTTGTSHSPL
ncbi:hypothetical protein INT46_007229 [Mucor plumbeus]|uniref:Uncharacterized protein n=1 Tax=Mucor plumbeus TaxID=97098 RepID=A0A8H7RBW6_9FUNG|nr:hypothetical protein INT46_007229 [Mucor plumbeus]